MKKVYVDMYDKAAINYGAYATRAGIYRLDLKGNLYLHFPRLHPIYGNKRLIATAREYADAKAR